MEVATGFSAREGRRWLKSAATSSCLQWELGLVEEPPVLKSQLSGRESSEPIRQELGAAEGRFFIPPDRTA